MKIAQIETIQHETPRYYDYVSGHLIVKIHTDEGFTGLGEASDSKAKDVPAVARRFNWPGLGVELDEAKMAAMTVAKA